MDPKEILVTGGTGSLGRRVVDRLIATGREVRMLSRSGSVFGVRPVGFCEGAFCALPER